MAALILVVFAEGTEASYTDGNPVIVYDIDAEVKSAVISKDNRYIISSSLDDKIHLFDRYKSTIGPVWSNTTNDYISSVAISSKGDYFAAGDVDGKVYLFQNNKAVSKLWHYSSDYPFLSVDISANGDYIVAGSEDNKVYLFNKNESAPIWTYTANDDVYRVAISSDSQYIVASTLDASVYVFHRDNSEPLWSYSTEGLKVFVAISDDGEYIVAGSSDYKVYFFQKDSQTPVWIYSTANQVNSVDISADGKYITAGSDDANIYLFHKDNNGTPTWLFDTDEYVASVAISSDGKYVTAASGDCGDMFLFDTGSDRPLSHSNRLDCTANSPIISISGDGEYILNTNLWNNIGHLSLFKVPEVRYFWTSFPSKERYQEDHNDYPGYSIITTSSTDGNYIFAGGKDGWAYLYTHNSSIPLWSTQLSDNCTGDHCEPVYSIAISGDGEYMAAGTNSRLHFFNKENSNSLWTYLIGPEHPECIINSIAISEEGDYIVAGSNSNEIFLFHKDSDDPLWIFDTDEDDDGDAEVEAVAISADGEYIAAGDNRGKTYLFDKDSSTPLWTSQSETGKVRSIAISSNGQYIISTGGGGTALFDKYSSTPHRTVFGGNYVAISSNGTNFVVADWNTWVLYYDRDVDGDLWRKEMGHPGCSTTSECPITSLSITPDGKYVAIGGEREVSLLDNTGKSIWNYYTPNLEGRDTGLTSVKISEDARQIVAGGPIGRVYLFNNYDSPSVTIVSVNPSPARFDDEISIISKTNESKVVKYEWFSSIDGYLGSESNFTGFLNSGVHVISFRAMNDQLIWSEPQVIQLYVEPYFLPTAHFTWTSIIDGEQINFTSVENIPTIFNGSLSLGYNLTYEWNFGDGSTATGPFVSHTYEYQEDGFVVTLTVIDQLNNSDSISYTIVPALKARPDIYISSLSFSNNTPIEGEIIEITATIKLLEMEVTENFEVGFFLDSVDGESIGSVTVNGTDINVGIESEYLASITWIAVLGQHTIYVIADSTNVVDENEEKNDIFTSIIVIAGKDEEENTSPSCQNGDTKVADDDCNQCVCSEGEWICTEVACNPDDKDEGKDEGKDESLLPSVSMIPALILIGLIARYRRK